MHDKKLITSGKILGEAEKVLIMLHGRGANAENILSLASYLNVSDYSLIAPQAAGNTWYPYSFLAPVQHNEPWLSSALSLLDEIVQDIVRAGTGHKSIYFLGFSQGACLTLEFITRNARRWGGAVAFTGGLIGDRIYRENYEGDFGNMPVFIGAGDPDPHVPRDRIHASAALLREMNAFVTEKIYPGIGHTVAGEEIEEANRLVFNS
jgi:phospholipase/carboxylesterase